MKFIANNDRSILTRGVFCLGWLVLSGCALPDKPSRPEPYDLGPPLVAAAVPAAGAPLALQRVESSAAIDGTAIVYRLLYAGEGAQQPRPYAQARWVMSPPQLVTQRLREALAATRPVVEPGLGLARVGLSVELQEFAQNFSAPGSSEGVVQLRVTAIASGGTSERLLGQRSFRISQPATSADAAGGAQALRQATDEAVTQVVAWVDSLPMPR